MADSVEGKVRGKREKENVPMAQFIEVWEDSANAPEAAKRLGLTVNSVQTRASSYRKKHKIPLKNMPKGGGAKLDAAAGIALVAKLRAQAQESAA